MTAIIVYHQIQHYLAIADEKTLKEKQSWFDYACQTKSHYGTYSGHDTGKNNPFLQGRKENLKKGIHGGVIPTGFYKLGNWGRFVTSNAVRLTPQFSIASGRGSFQIHGDYRDAKKWGTASEGCIVTPLAVRHALEKTGIKTLRVVYY